MLDLMAEALATSGKGFGVAETEQMQAMKTGALIVASPVMGAQSAVRLTSLSAIFALLRHLLASPSKWQMMCLM